jgi:hypothetical protein
VASVVTSPSHVHGGEVAARADSVRDAAVGRMILLALTVSFVGDRCRPGLQPFISAGAEELRPLDSPA